MDYVIKWIFNLFAYLVDNVLSWKIIGDFSILHIILGYFLLVVLIEFLSFGFLKSGSTADYIGGIRRSSNSENKKDKKYFKLGKKYRIIDTDSGEVL